MEKRASLSLIAAFLSSAVWAQSSNRESSNPALPGDILGPQLVAWSQMQTPHPVPQPLPGTKRPDPQAPVPSNPQAEQPASQSFIGTIKKDAGMYVLKTSDGGVYQIDDQARGKIYEGKRVKISGTLDPKTNILHLETIDLLS